MVRAYVAINCHKTVQYLGLRLPTVHETNQRLFIVKCFTG